MLEVYTRLKQNILKGKIKKLFYEIDMPLIPIVAKMEYDGILIDNRYLLSLKKSFENELSVVREKIDNLLETPINIRSPKQLSVLLFDRLKFPIIKKNKTGPSTDYSVLEQLDNLKVGPIPRLILDYREIDKLLSTYIRPFIELSNKKTNRIHTHFQLNHVATGRFSSDKPNLQNIPVRTERGKKIRKVFIAPKGYKLISADYSQIELRVLAYLSQDPVMKEAFDKSQDIHEQTAIKIFGGSKVTDRQRSIAKTINFGLMYGQGAYGLSNQLKIPKAQAEEFINEYFTRFSRVKTFLDSLKEIAEKQGLVENMFGRIRKISGIHSNNRIQKSSAERVAINTPIQGAAADIIKKAMLQVASQIKEKKLKSKMLLQVHDELLFECPQGEVDKMKKIIVQEMESATTLSVPLTVFIKEGSHWAEL